MSSPRLRISCWSSCRASSRSSGLNQPSGFRSVGRSKMSNGFAVSISLLLFHRTNRNCPHSSARRSGEEERHVAAPKFVQRRESSGYVGGAPRFVSELLHGGLPRKIP